MGLLILAIVGSFRATGLFVAASALNFVSALFMVALSVINHSRSPRPSIPLSLYLFITLLLDIAQARTLFLVSHAKPDYTYSSLFITAVVVKAVVLVLEAKPKARWVQWDEKVHSPEETSSLFSLGLLVWLNDLFRLGFAKIMDVEDLYPLDSNMDARLLHDRFIRVKGTLVLKGQKYGLVKLLARTLAVQLFLPVIPRLCMLGFTFCQPLLLEGLTKYLSESEKDPNVGYGFIGAAFFIYSGIAVSMALYW